MSWLLPRLNHGAGRLSSYIQSQHLISSRTAWGPIWWAAVGPEGRGSLAACASNRVFATDSASSSPVDGDSQGKVFMYITTGTVCAQALR